MRAPDGYTILGISLAHAVNPWLYKLPYDPIKAFAPIGIMGKGPVVLSVNPGPAGQIGEGAGGAGQEQARRPAIRLRRRRLVPASRRRAVQAHGRRRHPARAVQGRRPGDDRRDGRPHQGAVLLAGADHAAHQVRQAARARRRRHRAQHRCCRTCRPSRRPAFPATPRRTGGASSHRPARPQPIVDKLLRGADARRRTIPRRRNISTTRAPPSSR